MKTLAVLMKATGATAQELAGTWEADLTGMEPGVEARVRMAFGDRLTQTCFLSVTEEDVGTLDLVIVYEGPWETTPGDTLYADLVLIRATFNGLSTAEYIEQQLGGTDDPGFDAEQAAAELLAGLGQMVHGGELVAHFTLEGDHLTVEPEGDDPLTLTRAGTTAVRAVSWGRLKARQRTE